MGDVPVSFISSCIARLSLAVFGLKAAGSLLKTEHGAQEKGERGWENAGNAVILLGK